MFNIITSLAQLNQMVRKVTHFALLLLFCIFSASVSALENTGNNMLTILGKDKNSSEFQQFQSLWGLDKKYESNTRGLKVFVNDANAKVESILFAGENFTLDNSRFLKYNSSLPFGIALTDNIVALSGKLGAPQQASGETSVKFNHLNVTVEVVYASTNRSLIYSVKCYKAPGIKDLPIIMASIGGVTARPEVKPAPSEIDNTNDQSLQFKRAIMDVFKSYKESAFYNVKGAKRADKNYWNYKYTYSSRLKIPGEKFSMLYSYPFASSSLDFVSVIKESDNYDKAFEQTYHEFEKKLMETFPAKDGWVASCIPNKESKTMSDIELRNDRYGAVVLDYCRNPKGRHILYMRFLLFSN